MSAPKFDVLAWFDGLVAGSEAMDRASGIGPSSQTSSARQARAAVAELIAADDATIKAFEALGNASGVVENTRAHQACERTLVAQKSALACLTSGEPQQVVA